MCVMGASASQYYLRLYRTEHFYPLTLLQEEEPYMDGDVDTTRFCESLGLINSVTIIASADVSLVETPNSELLTKNNVCYAGQPTEIADCVETMESFAAIIADQISSITIEDHYWEGSTRTWHQQFCNIEVLETCLDFVEIGDTMDSIFIKGPLPSPITTINKENISTAAKIESLALIESFGDAGVIIQSVGIIESLAIREATQTTVDCSSLTPAVESEMRVQHAGVFEDSQPLYQQVENMKPSVVECHADVEDVTVNEEYAVTSNTPTSYITKPFYPSQLASGTKLTAPPARYTEG